VPLRFSPTFILIILEPLVSLLSLWEFGNSFVCYMLPPNLYDCIRITRVVENIYKKSLIYQMGNHSPHIEEEQTTQWPKEKIQKEKIRSTKHAHETKDRITRTPLKPGMNSCAPEG